MHPDFVVLTDKSALDREWVVGAIRSSYWGAWMTEAQLTKAIDASLCFGLYRRLDMLQIGFARAVTDGATFSSVMDAVVRDGWRAKGFGSMLMYAIVEHHDIANTICILDTSGADKFYERFGFVRGRAVMKRDPS